MRIITALIFTLCAAAMCTRAAQSDEQSFYVLTKAGFSKVSEDPAKYPAKRWQIWLYPANTTVAGVGTKNLRWGMIETSTSELAMRQLKVQQNAERDYCKFFNLNGCPPWGKYTTMNPGPLVALLDDPATNVGDVVDKITRTADRLETTSDLLPTIGEVLGRNRNAFQGFPTDGPVAGYLKRLHAINQYVDEASSLTDMYTSPASWQISRDLNEANEDLVAVESSHDQLSGLLSKAARMSADDSGPLEIGPFDFTSQGGHIYDASLNEGVLTITERWNATDNDPDVCKANLRASSDQTFFFIESTNDFGGVYYFGVTAYYLNSSENPYVGGVADCSMYIPTEADAREWFAKMRALFPTKRFEDDM